MSASRDTVRLIERLFEHARIRPDAVAYQEISPDGPGRRLTYCELRSHASTFASRLLPDAAGQTVVICLPNLIEFPVAFLGAWMAGLTVFPVSADAVAVELLAAIDKSDASVVIGAASLATALADRPHVKHITDVMLPGETQPRVARNAPTLLLQSSGTTGRPGIAVRGGPSIDAVCEQMCASIGVTPGDAFLAMVPLCHSYGLEHGLLAPLWAGAAVRLGERFDFATVLRELTSGVVTIFPAVPSVFEMLSHLAPDGSRFPSLRAAYSAGAALPRAIFDRCHSRLGIAVGQVYGATEIGSVTYNDPDRALITSCAGQPMRNVEIRIAQTCDPTMAVAPQDEGQVLIRARSMLDRYITGPAPMIDGFFPTGDIGRLDAHGNLTITGRLKLLIDVGGLKVNPMEVEDVIQTHPSVGSCVVVPMHQSETVHRLKAVVTPRDADHPPDVEDLRRFARERLTPYKVPRVFEIRSSLPRTVTGKILRHLVESK